MGWRQGPNEARAEDGRSVRRRGGQFARAPRPRMADMSEKPAQPHRAVAEAELSVAQETLSAVVDGTNPRGEVLAVAELAGVIAGKRASELLPLLPQAMLTNLTVEAMPDRVAGVIRIHVETAAASASGVGMEALTAAAVAALAAYDMIREEDSAAYVRSVRLLSTTDAEAAWHRPEDPVERPRPKVARGAGRVSSRRPGR